MVKQRRLYTVSLTSQDDLDMQTALSKWRLVDIVRLGVKQALKECPKVSKEQIRKVKAIIQ